jgi:hypothetical protein
MTKMKKILDSNDQQDLGSICVSPDALSEALLVVTRVATEKNASNH